MLYTTYYSIISNHILLSFTRLTYKCLWKWIPHDISDVRKELRLGRLEYELLSRLERGSLSIAEESRLKDLRQQRAALQESALRCLLKWPCARNDSGKRGVGGI